jgi:long-subunit fatty acid transport protein
VENSIEGDGGLNQVFWGNAFKIGKNLRLGINANYLFGESRRRSVINFVDSLYILGTKTETSIRGSDFVFDYGAQYDIHLDNGHQLTLGLIYANTFHLKATRKYLATTIINALEGGVDIVKDTVAYEQDEKGKITLQVKAGLGFTYINSNKWLIGADFEWQNWSKFKGFGVADTLDDSWRIAVGGEYTPTHTSISSLFTRMTYRLGFRYNNSYLNISNHQINEFGISFGFNFPLRKTRTSLDLGVEIGKRGTTADNLVQENFINFTFGVSINENWFNKRKYQ